MNNERRKRLAVIHAIMERVHNELEDIHSEQEEAMENMPENMQYNSDRWYTAEEALNAIDYARDNADDLKQNIEDHVTGNVRDTDMIKLLQG